MNHPENICPECGSNNISFISGFGLYMCDDCSVSWDYGIDNPDDGLSTVTQLFGQMDYARAIADGGKQYLNPIPPIYQPPVGIPLYWRNEQTGRLPSAVEAYLHYRIGGELPTDDQIFLVRCYLEHYINAPCWEDDGKGTIAQLKNEVVALEDCSAIDRWLEKAMEVALDPL